ncbi:hypothetical protein CBR_g50000 [Chara braunii]|uniref:Uncharacterized protein n=1 Tax=Chara braunii TaxID=69332 RepID=A0A388K573_CHABU|nr:hypothetical protein CBR_g50000 [Chara braunii]|eukprot:GBG65208.1 hypothetical protein CBR_g50000 [Chara braunii]
MRHRRQAHLFSTSESTKGHQPIKSQLAVRFPAPPALATLSVTLTVLTFIITVIISVISMFCFGTATAFNSALAAPILKPLPTDAAEDVAGSDNVSVVRSTASMAAVPLRVAHCQDTRSHLELDSSSKTAHDDHGDDAEPSDSPVARVPLFLGDVNEKEGVPPPNSLLLFANQGQNIWHASTGVVVVVPLSVKVGASLLVESSVVILASPVVNDGSSPINASDTALHHHDHDGSKADDNVLYLHGGIHKQEMRQLILVITCINLLPHTQEFRIRFGRCCCTPAQTAADDAAEGGDWQDGNGSGGGDGARNGSTSGGDFAGMGESDEIRRGSGSSSSSIRSSISICSNCTGSTNADGVVERGIPAKGIDDEGSYGDDYWPHSRGSADWSSYGTRRRSREMTRRKRRRRKGGGDENEGSTWMTATTPRLSVRECRTIPTKPLEDRKRMPPGSTHNLSFSLTVMPWWFSRWQGTTCSLEVAMQDVQLGSVVVPLHTPRRALEARRHDVRSPTRSLLKSPDKSSTPACPPPSFETFFLGISYCLTCTADEDKIPDPSAPYCEGVNCRKRYGKKKPVFNETLRLCVADANYCAEGDLNCDRAVEFDDEGYIICNHGYALNDTACICKWGWASKKGKKYTRWCAYDTRNQKKYVTWPAGVFWFIVLTPLTLFLLCSAGCLFLVHRIRRSDKSIWETLGKLAEHSEKKEAQEGEEGDAPEAAAENPTSESEENGVGEEFARENPMYGLRNTANSLNPSVPMTTMSFLPQNNARNLMLEMNHLGSVARGGQHMNMGMMMQQAGREQGQGRPGGWGWGGGGGGGGINQAPLTPMEVQMNFPNHFAVSMPELAGTAGRAPPPRQFFSPAGMPGPRPGFPPMGGGPAQPIIFNIKRWHRQTSTIEVYDHKGMARHLGITM